jgi:hypothetical protein
MAKIINEIQSTRQEKLFSIDWTVALPTNVTVTSITSTHTPPLGAAVTPTNDYSAAPVTHTYMPSGLAIGVHLLDIVATTSNASISPHVRFTIRVDY